MDAPATLAQFDGAPIVAHSTLPRLRRAWTMSGVKTSQWRYEETSPAFGGVLMGWSGSGAETALVAIELATGKERWRIAEPQTLAPQIEFVTGMVLVNGAADGDTTALDLETGRQRWKAKLCGFYDHVRNNDQLGVVRCIEPMKTTKSDDGSSYSAGRASLLAFELATGKPLWRREAGAGTGAHADVGHGNAAIGGREIYVQWEGKLRSLEPRTGREVRQVALPAPAWSWSTLDVLPGGRPVALVTGGGGGVAPNQLAALGLGNGKALWTRPYPQGHTSDGYGLAVRNGRLFEARLDEIIEIDLSTGQVARTCALPRVDTQNRDRRWRVMRGQVVAIMDAGGDKTPVVVRCDAEGGPPALAVLPQPATPRYRRLVAAEDGVIVVRDADELVAFRVFETDVAEEVALSPVDRVKAILDRAGTHPGYTAASIANDRAIYDELRAVPEVDRHVMALAKEAHPTRRERAVDAAIALRLPGVVDLLLDEISRPAAVPRVLTDDELNTLNAKSRVDLASEEYARGLWRRADQLVLLAAMDDAKVAQRLAPLLLARSTPAGLGWWDWNIWGRWSEDRYGLPAWDGASRRERRAHARRPTGDAGHSGVLTTSVGRSESHAAIYRLLARLGRREDAARLSKFDRATARSGGWAAICDADDAIKEPGPKRFWVEPWGVCRGIDVGAYRVTQSRDILWLRRRRADGSLGPPAWALDQIRDECNDRRLMQTAVMQDGRIVVGGMRELRDPDLATIDPAAVFGDADRDGLTDKTEAAFGTDPKRADTDGDGVPDGRDPAPLASPVPDARGTPVDEMVRFATLFLVGGPLTWQGEPAEWGESRSAAGLLLHARPGADVDDQACDRGRARQADEATKPRRVRTPFPVASVESLEITGDKAQGRFIWSEGGTRLAHDLWLARVQGQWRVIDDRPIANYR